MGKKTKVSGQAGAVGKNAHVHNNTFNQTVNAKKTKVKKQIKRKRNVAIDGDAKDSIIIIGKKNIVADKVTTIKKSKKTYTALHQLPPSSADFVGREKEMSELLYAVEKGGVTISSLHGMGGIGKTALALKLAEQLKPKYPDAQFYLDLKGASSEPLSSSNAMAHVIRSFHPKARLPEDENSLRGLYNSLLNGKKVFLLMDNAASAAQVKPLIPPDGSIMLVTSRNAFYLSKFFVKKLDTLELKDAKELLLKIAPRIGEYSEKIAELCDYLPLALEVAASALHEYINLTPDEYIELLSDATKRLNLVDASLSLSYELLSDKLKIFWRSLSVFPSTFDDRAVAALCGMEVKDAKFKLAKLISYSVIEWNETTRRYRLHDLVRLFADSHLGEQERLAVQKTHATYYKNLLAIVEELYLKGGASMISGLARFDLEWENIEAGQSWVYSLWEENKTAIELSRDYYFAGLHVLSLRLHPREQIRCLEVVLKATQLLEDKPGEGAALGNLGNAYTDLGEYRKAIQFHEQHLAIARETSDRQGEGTSLGNLGIAYKNLSEVRKAIEFYKQHLEIACEIGDRRGESRALGNLGNAYTDLGEYRKAIQFHEQHLAIAHEVGNRLGEGMALGNLGNAYSDLGDVRKAIEFFEQRLEIAREIGNRIGEGVVLGNLGVAYSVLGEAIKAIEFHKQCLAIAREIGDRRGEGMALWNSALEFYQLGDLVQAVTFAEITLAIFEQIEHPYTSMVCSYLEKWKSKAS
jgi:tetratricopeptide (TPR) repeat protein